jgi:tRNA threonylcarbamoyladenosine biosynthesis protein TsaB
VLLAIDTSTRYAGIALCDEGRVVSCHSWYSAVNHTVELMPAVVQALASQGLGAGDLKGIAVALGPGGFSALKVGMSVVKGLAVTAGKPVVGVGTLDLEAHPYLDSGLPVCALLDAGRAEVASALFGPDGRRTREDVVCPAEQLVECFDGPTLFCGEGVLNWRGLIRDRLGPSAVAVLPTPASRLWALSEVGWKRLAAGDTSDLATLQPIYLRMPSIGGPKRKDWTPQRP